MWASWLLVKDGGAVEDRGHPQHAAGGPGRRGDSAALTTRRAGRARSAAQRLGRLAPRLPDRLEDVGDVTSSENGLRMYVLVGRVLMVIAADPTDVPTRGLLPTPKGQLPTPEVPLLPRRLEVDGPETD